MSSIKPAVYWLLATYFLINSTINATSKWMEETRDGVANFHIIEPLVGEDSSAISILLLLLLLAIFWQRTPLKLTDIKSQLAKHFALSLLFSMVHVSIMLLLREVPYWLKSSTENF